MRSCLVTKVEFWHAIALENLKREIQGVYKNRKSLWGENQFLTSDKEVS